MDKISYMEKMFINTQLSLKHRIDTNNKVDPQKINNIAGVDLAYWKENGIEYAVCCIVVINKDNEIIEKAHYKSIITIPYIPGCLAFREVPLVLEAVKQLKNSIDLFVFDGNGYLHPRNMGLATHAGILINKPSIGVAKTYFKIDNLKYIEPENKAFAYTDIVINDLIWGRAVRTHENVKPIFLSVGHQIDIETATEIIKGLVTKDSRIPIPTRLADIMTHEERKELQK